MKQLCLICFAVLCTLSLSAQNNLEGSWQLKKLNGASVNEQVVAIYSDSYFMFGQYTKDGKFLHAGGGSYTVDDQKLQQIHDFHTADTALIRNPISFTYQLKNKELTIKDDSSTMVWQRMGQEESPLTGAWRFAARVDENGQAGERRGAGPRQTIKILSGNCFQWAAFNYETKEFSGTGGGTYQAEDGQYTENIRFFSRDNSRVGKSLSFQYEIEGNDWHHQGNNSRGEPMHEIWEKIP